MASLRTGRVPGALFMVRAACVRDGRARGGRRRRRATRPRPALRLALGRVRLLAVAAVGALASAATRALLRPCLRIFCLVFVGKYWIMLYKKFFFMYK